MLGLYRALYRDNGKENGNHYKVYWGYIGVLRRNLKGIGLDHFPPVN